MTVTVPGPATEAFPEPGAEPTPESVLAQAREIAESLVNMQALTEARTYYSAEVHTRLAEAGLYRLLTPRRFGGYEFGIDTFLRVATILARGCPSTGWMYCLGATHALAATAFFSEQTQAEIFADADFICPATIVPSGTATRTEDGDWLVEGTWNYCSGSPYATHFIGHALIPDAAGGPPTPAMFVAPRDRWRRPG
jgi:3-hydroxy-9,10-secoandrosta-1,3,5(10)-triene-9,17-dione monooxygenase